MGYDESSIEAMKMSTNPEYVPAPEPNKVFGVRLGSILHIKASLAQKSVLTMLAMFAYFSIASIVVAYERNVLVDAVQLLMEVSKEEERQVALNALLFKSVQMANENLFSSVDDVSAKVFRLEIEGVQNGLKKLQYRYLSASESLVLLGRIMAEWREQPGSTIIENVRSILNRLVTDFGIISNDIEHRKREALEKYESTRTRLTMEWIFFFIIGLGLLSALMVFFLRGLTRDMKLVEQRATAIVRGYRGEPLPVLRHDELGDLIVAVNQMQNELRKHEVQIEIGRQQRFHKEKMAAIGSLSATIAHEINNPLSAIIGIAQAMKEFEKQDGREGDDSASLLDALMEQAKRVMLITRQLGEFSVPQSHEPELIDINGLVRSTCKFAAFDGRFRGLQMHQQLDAGLPAAYAVADHIVQILLNLLLNAADALENVTDRVPRIVISTSLHGEAVKISVADNGCGIDPQTIGKVFDEHFTTKAPGKGSGLGLALCRALIHDAGGDIVLTSVVNEGTTVSLTLPLKRGTVLSKNNQEE